MIKIILNSLAILFLAVVQVTLFSKFSFFGSVPNLILLTGLSLMIRGDEKKAYTVAAIGGLFLDFVSPIRFGLFTATSIFILFLTNLALKKFLSSPNFIFIGLIFFTSFLFLNLTFSLILFSFNLTHILIDSTINTLWGFVIYFISVQFALPQEEIKAT